MNKTNEMDYEEPSLYEDGKLEVGVAAMTDKEKAAFRDPTYVEREAINKAAPVKKTKVQLKVNKPVIQPKPAPTAAKNRNVLSEKNTLIYDWDDKDITKLLEIKPEKVIFYTRITQAQLQQLTFLTIKFRTKIVAGQGGKVLGDVNK